MPRKRIAPTLDRLVKGNTIFEAEEPQAEREFRALLAVARAAQLVLWTYRWQSSRQISPVSKLETALRRLERVSGGKP